MIISLVFVSGLCSKASLKLYDQSLAADEIGGGPISIAKLTSATTLNGSNSFPFNFGAVSGESTFEFIVEGDPVAGGRDGYLAVGSNSSSSLRYEQWSDTGQLGFTQGGVADYTFSPLVLSPTEATHVTYVWDGDGRMDLYLDGTLVGQNTAVASSFNMPTGNGLLGNNAAAGNEGMVGTIHRVTIYNEALTSEDIERHSNAYNDVPEPPTIDSFAASPEAFLAPGSSTLNWSVTDATSLSINGVNVTGQSQLVVFPPSTTTYTLSASNEDGTSTQNVVVTVNPVPQITSFISDRITINAGESVTLRWSTKFANAWAITPAPGDVSAQTGEGNGSITLSPSGPTTYTLTATNSSGSKTSEIKITVAMVADHPVISEFMAANETGLQDGDGEFSDWIEIFNPTASSVDLSSYFLTEDSSDLTKWSFPPLPLAPGERIIVFASGKGAAGPAGEIHTNFKLSAGGEYLALVTASGSTLLQEFAPTYPALDEDVSYGILRGDLSTSRVLGTPTPGQPNDASIPPPSAVTFSLNSRTFSETLNLSLATETAGASIYYTTDGSTPSTKNGILYSSAINLTSTSHLRAIAVREGVAGPISGENFIRLAADLVNYESDLPLMIIDNFGAGTVPAKGWSGTGSGVQQVARQNAVWATFDRNETTGLASLTDPPQMISRTGIRGRGAFSSTWSQKPYSMEVWDENGEEKDVNVLGMPAHSDWVLYYPDTDRNKDPSMMFNTFMYELSNNMGRYAARIRWVEAFVNTNGGALSLADRRGVYAIFEKVSRGEGRLEFDKLTEDGTEGGWLLGLNRMDSIPVGGYPAENGSTRPQLFHTRGPNRVSQTSANSAGSGDDIPRQSNGYLNFDNPSGYRITATQRTAIEDWFVEFEDVLYDNSQWLDPINGYRKYLDPKDFVEYFMFNNLSRNGDGMLISMFPWKGDDGKLRMGPAWDYNWSSYYVGGGPTGTFRHRGDRLWYRRLFDDPDFEQLYVDRWFYHRDRAMSNTGIESIVNEQAAEIGTTRAIRQGFSNEGSWNSELNTFKNWLTTRADWYDGQFTPRPVYNQNGGEVAGNFIVKFSPPPGTIYYTTDGSDPRRSGGGISPSAIQFEGGVTMTKVVAEGDAVRVTIPTATAPPSGLGWTSALFNDTTWLTGTTGVGYDRVNTYDPHINLNLDTTMGRVNTSAYLRLEFDLANASSYDVMRLKMKYDDGFVAYLNGALIASENAPATLVWDSGANGGHSDTEAVNFVTFDVNAHVGELVNGTNILAIHGLNDGIGSSDFLITPELEVGQSTVSNGLVLNESVLITARTRDGSDWSAPAEAYFLVDTIPASAENLVISEFHYRPADASAIELAAGFTDRDDFEFIELMNRGSQTINLNGVKFVDGVTFDFSTAEIRSLDSGARVLIVKNLAAFEERYGNAFSSKIAGEYSGNLSNDGELITLVDATGTNILSFTFNDQSPWPEEPDGDSYTLVLINPMGPIIPEHGDPANWRASASSGGSPGGSGSSNYNDWKIANGLPIPETDADPDRDGRDNLLEYFEGTNPNSSDLASGTIALESLTLEGVTKHYIVFRFRRNLTADDVSLAPQISVDLNNWLEGSANIVLHERTRISDTQENLVFRSTAPAGSALQKFGRLKLQLE
ncbi:CotH kinase family protein [Akkermansiaceae bacterium]|nr:CotH kinase family protein [Akkermansiaceae bacterium]MDA7539672.1 CotH kinase family protein [Akkermansiaceae bacterium]MDA7656085.1 CotH kinase family protein [Akkermansiaceae bacterium]MDB4355062.1 CotH kinase family protein [Akkermansiaceae bacterium]MDB4375999.1 CotH kinase family protein [Akkermansiaceae bacterium]